MDEAMKDLAEVFEKSAKQAFEGFQRAVENFIDWGKELSRMQAVKERARLRAFKHSRQNNKTVKLTPHGRQYRVRRVRK